MPEEHSVITERVSLKGVSTVAFAQVLRTIMERMLWEVVADSDGGFLARTHGFYSYYGAEVRVSMVKNEALINVQPVDVFYTSGEDCRVYMDRLLRAIELESAEMEQADRNLHPMHREKYGALLISKSYLVTPVLVYMNVFVYLLMVLYGISPLSPAAASLFRWGGNFGPSVAAGEWWRLVSYMFLHGGAVHLLGNTFALLYVGMFLEPMIGKRRFAIAYLLTGLGAGLASIWAHSAVVSVGASGAIFGTYGVFLALLTTSFIKRSYRKTMIRSILFFVVFNLMYGLQGNTDNAAHVGGLVAGFLVGYAMYPGLKR
jgi:rhomboid protease GluP